MTSEPLPEATSAKSGSRNAWSCSAQASHAVYEVDGSCSPERQALPPRILRGLNATALLEPWIAVSWQALLTRATGTSLALSRRMLLFTGVWLVYTADRWLDARLLRSHITASYRHQFAFRHRRAFAFLWSSVLLLSVLLARYVLSVAEWQRCLGLLLSAIGYTTLVHFGRTWREIFTHSGAKEVAVAALFAGGAVLFVQPSDASQARLLACTATLFGLALLNLLLIAELEVAQDRAQAHASIAQAPRPTRLGVKLLAYSTLGAGLLLASIQETWSTPQWTAARLPVALCLPLGALLLLRKFGSRFTTDTSHALADLALLLPLAVWPWLD